MQGKNFQERKSKRRIKIKKENVYSSVDKEKATIIDNFIDKVTLPIAEFIVKYTTLTANQVSLLSFLLFVLPAIVLFSFGRYIYNLLALLLCFGYMFFDFVDGKVARLTSSESELGKWLEDGLDWLCTNLIPVALIIGIVQNANSLFKVIVGIIFITLLNINTYISSIFEKRFNFYSDKKAVKEWYSNIVREKGASIFEIFIKNMLDPHGFLFYFFFSIRYILGLGIIFNRPFWAIFLLTITFLVKISLMYYLLIAYMHSKNERILIIRELNQLDKSK